MSDGMVFDYYYGIEAEQFSFYRVPRLLIKDERFKGLSSDAKLLYGLMLDRMALSMKNGWFDEENRVYIYYTQEDIMDDLGCAREKSTKVIAELDSKKGIGLIEKKKQGLGKPDIIYVKNFVVIEQTKQVKTEEEKTADADVSPEIRKSNFKKFENRTSRDSETESQENRKPNDKRIENQTSRESETERQEIRKSNGIYNNNNENNKNNTNSIYPSSTETRLQTAEKEDVIDAMDNACDYIEVL